MLNQALKKISEDEQMRYLAEAHEKFLFDQYHIQKEEREGYQAEIAARDAEIAAGKAEITARDAEIAANKSKIAELEAKLAAYENQ